MSASSSPLSTSDRQLLREVFRWARANGWSVDNAEDGYHQWRDRDGWEVDVYVPSGPEMTVETATRRFGVWYPTSVMQAVDVLCALGVLPVALSSAYVAGAGSVYDRAEYRVTTPDGQRPGSNWPIYSVVDAFKTLGFWRRNGWHDAYLERRWDKEPGEWERVADAN